MFGLFLRGRSLFCRFNLAGLTEKNHPRSLVATTTPEGSAEAARIWERPDRFPSSSKPMKPLPHFNCALQKLRAGEVVPVYVTGNFASPRHVDFVCQSGHFGAIWFDLEHFDISTQELALLNMVARGHQVSAVARLKATDYQTVMRVLETGVGGIMCSMVSGAQEAREIVKWA